MTDSKPLSSLQLTTLVALRMLIGITCLMAHKSYIEKRRVEWDSIAKRIV